ncbi:MAG: AAA family ATPase [Verrucomicrobiae bacterium]|nr:AAA family ATPase [Verrucomicrobiae bacterium]
MATTPSQHLTRVLENLERALVPWVTSRLTARFGDAAWENELLRKAQERKITVFRNSEGIQMDLLLALHSISLFWPVFQDTLGKESKAHVQELREARNRRSHTGSRLTHKYVKRVADTAGLLLESAGLKDPGLKAVMQTIGVFNPRGGCGKSSTTIFLADFLSSLHGKRVLLVDLDSQRASSEILAGREAITAGLHRKASLPLLLREKFDGKADTHRVHHYLLERHGYQGPGSGAYLNKISILTCDRIDWWEFNDAFTKADDKDRHKAYRLLRACLNEVAHDFDICLIDFPANDLGPWARIGLHASDWWLLPCLPNWAGIRDLEAASALVCELIHQEKANIWPLATVPTLCQRASNKTYKSAVSKLEEAARRGYIPPLVPPDAQLSWRKEALEATDLSACDQNTMGKKYGNKTKPFWQEIAALTKHVLQRLNLPTDEIDFTGDAEDLNDWISGKE